MVPWRLLQVLALYSVVAYGLQAQSPLLERPIHTLPIINSIHVTTTTPFLEHDRGFNITSAIPGSYSLVDGITRVDGYTELTHSGFAGYRIRVKKTVFCDPTVNVYTGYLDISEGAKHMFFYFFESRRDPANDDVIMWINGGPGCSSAMGLLMELGPCNIDLDFDPTNEDSESNGNGTTWNPYGWNAVANVFFLDQPVGVGFSYADYGETISNTEDASKNVYAFIRMWFSTFSGFEGRGIHLTGESYGGRYLPVFAAEIIDRNTAAKSENRTQDLINLKSVAIGNGITDISTLYPGRYEIECGQAALEVPFQSVEKCVRMKTALPRCNAFLRSSCIDQFDSINCRAAVAFCDGELSSGMWATGRNVYDVSKMCIGSDLCYNENTAIKTFLNLPSTLQTLGVDPPSSFNFTPCSSSVSTLFNANQDKWRFPTQHYISALLDRGVRILIYAGTYDWQCNWVANRLWVDKLEWSGGKAWEALGEGGWSNWYSQSSSKAGEWKEYANLRFVTIRGAGHMVPHDKPAESLEMIEKWIYGHGM